MLPKIDTRIVEEIKLLTIPEKMLLRPYNVAQEKSILLSLTSENKNNWFNNIKNVIEANLKNGDINQVVTAIDFLYIAIRLRAISKGEKLNLDIRCLNTINGEQCQHIFEEPILIQDILRVDNSDSLRVVHKVNDCLTLELKPAHIDYVNFLAELSLDDAKKYENFTEQMVAKESLDIICRELSYYVSKVFIMDNKQEQMFDKFTHEEVLTQVIENLTVEEISNIYESKNKLINLYMKIEKTCPICKHKWSRKITNFFEFII